MRVCTMCACMYVRMHVSMYVSQYLYIGALGMGSNQIRCSHNPVTFRRSRRSRHGRCLRSRLRRRMRDRILFRPRATCIRCRHIAP